MHRRPFCRRWLMLSILWSWKKTLGACIRLLGRRGRCWVLQGCRGQPDMMVTEWQRDGLSTTVTSEYSHARRSFSQVLVPSQMLPISSFCMRYRRPSSLVFWRRHHHRTAIIIYAWHMEVQFNNEGLNIMFVFLIVSCPNFPWLIPKQVSITIVAFIDIPIATMMLSRDTLPVLVSALYRSLHIYPVTPTPSKIPSHEG